MRNSISSKKQNVRAWASSFSQVFGVTSVLKNCGEPPELVGAGAGDFEILVGEQRHRRLAQLQFNRLGRRVKFALLRLRRDAGFLDDFAKFARAAVGDGRLVRVQFDHRVVNAVARERGEDVLNGLHLDVALGERGGAGGLADIFHARLDFRLAVEVHAAEADAAAGGRGQNRHVDPVAAVQADAGETYGTIERLLIEHGQIRQNARAVGKIALVAPALRIAACTVRLRV